MSMIDFRHWIQTLNLNAESKGWIQTLNPNAESKRSMPLDSDDLLSQRELEMPIELMIYVAIADSLPCPFVIIYLVLGVHQDDRKGSETERLEIN